MAKYSASRNTGALEALRARLQSPIVGCTHPPHKGLGPWGCGAALKIAAVRGQIGSGSDCGNAISCGLPARFSTMLICGSASSVTQFSPLEMLRCAPRCPWMKVGWLAMYLSMYCQPYLPTTL